MTVDPSNKSGRYYRFWSWERLSFNFSVENDPLSGLVLWCATGHDCVLSTDASDSVQICRASWQFYYIQTVTLTSVLYCTSPVSALIPVWARDVQWLQENRLNRQRHTALPLFSRSSEWYRVVWLLHVHVGVRSGTSWVSYHNSGIHLQTSPHRIDIDNCLFSRYETALLSTVYTKLFEVIPGAVGAFSEKVELISYAKGMSR